MEILQTAFFQCKIKLLNLPYIDRELSLAQAILFLSGILFSLKQAILDSRIGKYKLQPSRPQEPSRFWPQIKLNKKYENRGYLVLFYFIFDLMGFLSTNLKQFRFGLV